MLVITSPSEFVNLPTTSAFRVSLSTYTLTGSPRHEVRITVSSNDYTSVLWSRTGDNLDSLITDGHRVLDKLERSLRNGESSISLLD